MSDRTRIAIAATVTALFLAVISAAGLATHRPAQQATPAAALTRSAAPQTPPATFLLGDDDGAYAQEQEQVDGD